MKYGSMVIPYTKSGMGIIHYGKLRRKRFAFKGEGVGRGEENQTAQDAVARTNPISRSGEGGYVRPIYKKIGKDGTIEFVRGTP